MLQLHIILQDQLYIWVMNRDDQKKMSILGWGILRKACFYCSWFCITCRGRYRTTQTAEIILWSFRGWFFFSFQNDLFFLTLTFRVQSPSRFFAFASMYCTHKNTRLITWRSLKAGFESNYMCFVWWFQTSSNPSFIVIFVNSILQTKNV